ncbi:MAG: hypothetical protein HY678_09445 [Chloroflexi bacterium]|nr:hypothetical protein [Chloroflexota bacterium]
MRISKRWLVGSLVGVAAVGSIAVGVAVAAPFGQEGGDKPSEKPRDRVLERAAEILGVEPDALENAFKQANEDIRKERRDEVLAKLVTDGVITKEDSDKIKTWLDARPDAWEKARPHLEGPHALRPHGEAPHGLRPHARPFHPPKLPEMPKLPEIKPFTSPGDVFDDLVEQGIITEEKAKELKEFFRSLPGQPGDVFELPKHFGPGPHLAPFRPSPFPGGPGFFHKCECTSGHCDCTSGQMFPHTPPVQPPSQPEPSLPGA